MLQAGQGALDSGLLHPEACPPLARPPLLRDGSVPPAEGLGTGRQGRCGQAGACAPLSQLHPFAVLRRSRP